MQLTEHQQNAVIYTGTPALVVAGAGSGKTRTLTAKIHHLIRQGFDPARILAITFTNKAAGEMKDRLRLLTGLSDDRFPWVRTYHSACYHILKEHCTLVGYEKPLQIYAAYAQQKLIKEILLEMNMDKKHAAKVMYQISNAKNSGNPTAYFNYHPKVARVSLAELFSAYSRALRTANAVDFDDILLQTRNILRDHKEVRQQYQELFQYILVDEYQDTNNLQEELTRLLLKNGNLFCVGDDWQAIYGFRGSNVSHFLSFPENYKDARIFRLEQNFRSADEIVRMANRLMDHTGDRIEKTCFSQKRGGIIATHRFFDDDEEARWVCRKIRTLQATGIPYHRIGILYRTKFCSLPFEKALRTMQIPYQMMGSRGFFERKEILDLNCYLTAAAFPKDDVAFDRVLNTPKRGIGPGTVKKIAASRTPGMSLQDAARKTVAERVMSPKIHKGLHTLLQALSDIRKMAPDAAIRHVITCVGYMDYLKQYGKNDKMDFITREENINQLLHTASRHRTLLGYLEEASLVKEDTEEGDEEESSSGVKLSTVHASKGLEYEVVFIAGCEENLFPHWKSLEFENDLQEERRLMYVAMTRAEKHLYITSAQYRKGQSNPRSRFLAELEHTL